MLPFVHTSRRHNRQNLYEPSLPQRDATAHEGLSFFCCTSRNFEGEVETLLFIEIPGFFQVLENLVEARMIIMSTNTRC